MNLSIFYRQMNTLTSYRLDKFPKLVKSWLLNGEVIFHCSLILTFVVFIFGPTDIVKAQDISIDWSVVLGGSSSEEAFAIAEASDDAYFVAGYTNSSDGDVNLNLGGLDIWIVKLAENGNIIWQKVIGGGGDEIGLSILVTADGGCIVTGYSNSGDGDLNNNLGGDDVFIFKLGSEGEVEWGKTYGGSGDDRGFALIKAIDQGYLIAGETGSNDGDISQNKGGRDFWIIKIDETGDIVWEKTYGGSGNEVAQSLALTNDGGFVIVGYTGSVDGDISSGNGFFPDYWVVKIDALGNLLWERTLGGTQIDWGVSVEATLDNGIVVSGQSESSNQDVSSNNGLRDYWIVKLDSNGLIQWEENLGSSSNDESRAIKALNDGSYIAVGWAGGQNGDVSSNNGSSDFWITKISNSGDLVWEMNFGGSNVDRAYAAEFTRNGKLLICGFSRSDDFDVGENKGGNDVWVIQLQGMITNTVNVIKAPDIVIYPNPSSGEIKIHFNFSSLPIGIKIFDVTGQLIHDRKTDKMLHSSQLQYSFDQLQSGVYFVQVVAGGYSTTKKFIVN